ncbi:MAG: hypothetical protein IJO88_07385, partial [Oscillospiraceae bacterium]|nr:hypothetical protein [Oscillospiraceae bacterium]
MKKRLFCMLLAVIMVLSAVPVTALAEETACGHASATTSVTYNGDRTHTTVTSCDSCGEAVANAAAALTVDFKSDVTAMAQQGFWANMDDVINYDAGQAVVENVKGAGWYYDADYSAITDTEKAAYAEAVAWLDANTNWTIMDDSKTDPYHSFAGKRIQFSAGSEAWGLRFFPKYVNNSGNMPCMFLSVDAPKAGQYELNVDVVMAAMAGSNWDGACAGGVLDVEVNGKMAIEHFATIGDGSVQTVSGGVVTLNEGANEITIRVYSDMQGNVDNQPSSNTSDRAVTLKSMSFAPVGEVTADCVDADHDGICDVCEANICEHTDVEVVKTFNGDKTHSIKAVCSACGETVANTEAATVINFKADVAAAAAANTDAWAAAKTATHYNRNIGGYEDINGIWIGNGQPTEAENASAQTVMDWIAANKA